jgi:hypothetical protein
MEFTVWGRILGGQMLLLVEVEMEVRPTSLRKSLAGGSSRVVLLVSLQRSSCTRYLTDDL